MSTQAGTASGYLALIHQECHHECVLPNYKPTLVAPGLYIPRLAVLCRPKLPGLYPGISSPTAIIVL